MLCELPTASSHFWSTCVLWVLTGTHPCGPPSKMMEVTTRAPALVDCGVWSWCCCQVVLWSHREVWEYECISTHLHWLPRFLKLVASLRFPLQVSFSVLQHNFCILPCFAVNREIVCFVHCTSSRFGKFVSMISLRFVVLFATVHAL